MYRITKTWRFAAAHRLDHLPETHKCWRPHGHNYRVTLTLEAPALDPDGFVVDYGELGESFGAWIDDNLDHRDLNEVTGNPKFTTAEHLAAHLYDITRKWDWHPAVVSVTVHETDNTSATFIP